MYEVSGDYAPEVIRRPSICFSFPTILPEHT
jgi:hypothetical protein